MSYIFKYFNIYLFILRIHVSLFRRLSCKFHFSSCSSYTIFSFKYPAYIVDVRVIMKIWGLYFVYSYSKSCHNSSLKDAKYKFQRALLIRIFNENDNWRQRDYCWQIHLPAELVLLAISACAVMISPSTTTDLLHTRRYVYLRLHSWELAALSRCDANYIAVARNFSRKSYCTASCYCSVCVMHWKE
jgi:hypothetical protein